MKQKPRTWRENNGFCAPGLTLRVKGSSNYWVAIEEEGPDAERHQAKEPLKELTGEFDWPCHFDCNGQCQGANRYGPTATRGCCFHCAENGGYLDYTYEEAVPALQKHWSVTTGFWRKGKGCVLPRKYRSDTCVSYICGDADPTGVFSEALDLIGQVMWNNRTIKRAAEAAKKLRKHFREKGLLK